MVTLQRFLFILAALLVLALALSFSTRASEVHLTGGVAIKGHDPVAYFNGGKPQRGQADLRHEHGGATYLFATTQNRDAFKASPERYLPRYGGYCAFGVAGGYKADIDPAAFSIVDGKLYLNYNATVQRDWSKDTAGFIRKADARWPEVKDSTKVIR
jgi:YHS domain-containing protein